jgi:peptidoglycan/LPS O-acetylase OafA/YrhL
MSRGEKKRSGEGGFQIPSLDGLRAVAFLIVFVAHAGLEKYVPGYFGLTVFFFLSGYLITTLLRIEYDHWGGISLRQFYLRRILRIFPPFYLVLGIASALTMLGLLEGSVHDGAVLAQVCHLSNYYVIRHGWWDGRAPGTWVYWSLAVEEHFYLAFPLLYLLLRRFAPSGRGQAAILAGLCLAFLAWRCFLVFALHAPKDRLYVASDTRGDSILFGCILAVWGNPALETNCISERMLKGLWLPLALAALLASFALRGLRFEQTFRYTIQGIALFPVFIAAIRYPGWGPFQLLNLRPVAFLGVLSYSLYLMHTTVLYGLHQWTPWSRGAKGPLALGMSILLAWLIYRFVEKPCARLRKRLSGGAAAPRRHPRGAERGAAAPAVPPSPIAQPQSGVARS